MPPDPPAAAPAASAAPPAPPAPAAPAARLRDTPLWTRAAVGTEAAARHARVDGAFHAVMLQWTGGAFLTAFALLLGAGPGAIGLIAALPLLVRLSQLYTSWRIERAGHWRRASLLGATVGRGAPLLLLPLALVPDGALPAGARVAWLLAVLVLTGAGAALFDIAWLTWMAVPVLRAVHEPEAAGVGRMLRVVGRARTMRLAGGPLGGLPLEPTLSAGYAHLARVAELVAQGRDAPRAGGLPREVQPVR